MSFTNGRTSVSDKMKLEISVIKLIKVFEWLEVVASIV